MTRCSTARSIRRARAARAAPSRRRRCAADATGSARSRCCGRRSAADSRADASPPGEFAPCSICSTSRSSSSCVEGSIHCASSTRQKTGPSRREVEQQVDEHEQRLDLHLQGGQPERGIPRFDRNREQFRDERQRLVDLVGRQREQGVELVEPAPRRSPRRPACASRWICWMTGKSALCVWWGRHWNRRLKCGSSPIHCSSSWTIRDFPIPGTPET